MLISELLANESLRLEEFPVAREKIYLGHAGDCPLPMRVARAIADYALRGTTADQEQIVYPGILEETRETAAQLLHCQSDEVGLVGPTSLALSLIASGLKFRRNDNILIYFDDYPSNVYPWMALAEQGLQVRLMNTRGLGVIRPRDVIGQIDENTRLVALATCHFISGYRIDYEEIGKQLRERNILFCLDAIQTLGAFPMKVEHVDFLAADAHKWLLGPCGAGLMYVRRELQAKLNPPIYGWNNVACPDFVTQEQISRQAGPRKFEPGTYNLLGLVGLLASMRLLLEVGVENIAAELLRKRDLMVYGLTLKGYTVLNGDCAPENAGAFVSFHHSSLDLPAIHQRLTDAGVVSSLRTDRAGKKYIRFSPHFYNTDAELERVFALL
jgi:selenocysteine lyase/cysteine desulfurase